ncbi:MotE family protein [Mahella australiensis]|uniref:MgtE intracellular region n=1 Tax=Mahella australiensis (strain DSM 15567 / CIP 107919 / 50-1 BON) TaxID=697281 RepID=F4A1M1_MAHA5|nr:MgtE integral membrane protein [Mahella australiensis]AEE96055.1 MgtE intracellular region [Mahella australiensis 50-1 BON]
MPEKNGGRSALAVVLAIIFILLAVFEAAIIFNIAGIRDMVSTIPFIGPVINGPELEAKADIEERTTALNKKDADLKAKETSLANKEAELEKREKAVDDKENQLAQKEQELVVKEAELNSKQMAIADMAKMYESMDAKQAAAILSEVDNDGLVIDILKRMKEDKAAAILEQMESKKAAELTKIMQP